MNNQKAVWSSLITGPRSGYLLRKVMWHVAGGLSGVVGRTIYNDLPKVEKVPIAQVPARAGGPEAEMVGIYLMIGGGLRGQAILILPMASALNLADVLLDAPFGTSSSLGDLECSALAEVGNLTVSYFLNAMAALTGIPLRPSPPAVMVDMLGAILNVVITSVAATSDDLLMIETILQNPQGDFQGRFWVLPDLVSRITEY